MTASSLSAVGAVDVDLDNLPFVYLLLYYYMGYLLSPFAMICFVTNLILNRIAVMTSVRAKNGVAKNKSAVILPLWSRVLFHGIVIVPLLYCIIQLLCELTYIDNWFVKSSVDNHVFFYTRVLLIVAFSNIIESFLATTTNTRSLVDFDYSLFELSAQFFLYSISLKYKIYTTTDLESQIKNQMLLDSLFATSSCLIIHALELLNLKDARLYISVASDIIFCFLAKKNIIAIVNVIPLCTTFLRIWFGILPMFVIIFTVCFKFIALIVKRQHNSQELTFFQNLNKFMRKNSDQEMMMTIMKLSKLLLQSSANPTIVNGVSDGTQDEKIPINNNYLISGYLKKLETTPDDIMPKLESQYETKIKLNLPYIFIKFRLSVEIFQLLFISLYGTLKKIVLCLLVLLRLKKRNIEPKEKKNTNKKDKKFKDLNKLITSKNYYKFLTRFVDPIENNYNGKQSNNNQYLLPDQDTSSDYELPTSGSDNKFLKSHDKEKYVPMDIKSMKNELVQLFLDFNSNMVQSTENLNWYNSMYSILKYELQNDKERLTRSQYGKLNDEAILKEVILERWTANENSHNHNIEESDDEEQDFTCVVCLQEARNIVFWPCRCLATCDDCRDALGSRGIHVCVACKTEVKGYTKLNIV